MLSVCIVFLHDKVSSASRGSPSAVDGLLNSLHQPLPTHPPPVPCVLRPFIPFCAQPTVLYVSAAALLALHALGLGTLPICSIATVPRVRVLTVGVACWSLVAALIANDTRSARFSVTLGAGVGPIVVAWALWMVGGGQWGTWFLFMAARVLWMPLKGVVCHGVRGVGNVAAVPGASVCAPMVVHPTLLKLSPPPPFFFLLSTVEPGGTSGRRHTPVRCPSCGRCTRRCGD